MNEDDFNMGGIEPVSGGGEPENGQSGTEPSQLHEEHTYRQGIYEEGYARTQGEYRQDAGGQEVLGPNQDLYAKKEDPFGQNAAPGAGSFAGQTGSFGQNTAGPGSFMQQETYQAPSRGFGIASLVLGIISLVLFCSCVNVILAAVAIVFGILQLVQKDAPKGMAIAGIVTSCLSIVLFFVALISFLGSSDFQDAMEHGYGYDKQLEDYFFGDGPAPDFDDDGNMYFPDEDSDRNEDDRDDDDYDNWDYDEDRDDTF